MNQTQIKYARERAAVIRKRREEALREKHTVTPKLLTDDEKLKALKTGAFTITPLKDRQTGNFRNSWINYVNFTGEVKGGLDLKAFNAEFEKLDAAYRKLIDELVLGDNEQALALLRAFEAA